MKKQNRLSEWQGKGLVLLALACWGGFWIPFVFAYTGDVKALELHMTIFAIATIVVLGVSFIVALVHTWRHRKELQNPFKRDFWK